MALEWEYGDDGSSLAEVAADVPLEAAMQELCRHLIADVLPRNQGISWDHLRVEIWSDSGSFIVFPASTESRYRVDKSACKLIFDELRQTFEFAFDTLDDQPFEAYIKGERRTYADCFVQTARDTQLRGLRMRVADADGELLDDLVI